MRSLTVAGMGLTLAGFACWGGGGFVAWQALDRAHFIEEAATKSEKSCKEQLVKLGGKVVPLPNNVYELIFDDVKDTRASLADAVAAEAMCPTRKVVEMCTGAACSAGGGTPNNASLTNTVRTVFKLGAPS